MLYIFCNPSNKLGHQFICLSDQQFSQKKDTKIIKLFRSMLQGPVHFSKGEKHTAWTKAEVLFYWGLLPAKLENH